MNNKTYLSSIAPDMVELRHFHLFCGLGGGARGFNRAMPTIGTRSATMRCIGGIDVDPASIRDFERLAGVPGTVLDLFDRDQYQAFHGNEPPASWREALPADIQAAAGHERPHIVFLSAPCKGFSGLLAESKSKSEKYQALNRLTLRGVWLMLEAWKNDPVELIVFENVPRIMTRGRHLLDQITGLLRSYGYAVAETTHDCGEIGGLAQSRKRFLLVARHEAKVPNFLYQPDSRPLKSVGTVLDRMLLPGDVRAGAMHRVPALHWKTWVRLAFVQAGSDWRSLNKLAVEDGQLRDYLLVPTMHNGMFGVSEWQKPMGTITGKGRPANGAYGVADPRGPANAAQYGQYGVNEWNESMGTVIGVKSPGQGGFAVADPRHEGAPKFNDEYKVVRWDRAAQAITGASGKGQALADPRTGFADTTRRNVLHVVDYSNHAKTITGASHTTGGAQSVADPRPQGPIFGKYAVTAFDEPSGTVISGSTTGQGAFAVADPRPNINRTAGSDYLTGGHYGVVPWEAASGAVSGAACHDNGAWSVADPRPMPTANQSLVCRIQALDGTWHRPFTTLELAALQSLVDPEELMELDGLSDQAWRERIGNAVPPEAAQAIAEVMGTTLLLAMSGETFTLSSQAIWVKPIAVALELASSHLNAP